MATLTITLDSLIGRYGQDWTEGILTDHLFRAAYAGFAEVIADNGTATIEGFPVLCGEIVLIHTEDGPIDGRCGQPAVITSDGDLLWCEAHTLFGYRDDCEHGMSAALCAGPGHYPMD